MSKYPLVNGGDGAPAELPAATTLNVNAGVTGGASLNIPCASGVAPMSPVDGDLWCTPSGMFLRVGSSTVGPFGAGGTPGGTSGQIQWNNTGAFDGFTMGGDITLVVSTGMATIGSGVVTLAKIANASANSVLVGSGASGSGASYSEIALGSGLAMTGTTLSATGSGGTVTHTAGALTLDQLVVGNGTADIKVSDLTGDITTSGGVATTLATVNSNVGSFTYASLTVNAKGLITAAASGAAPATAIAVSSQSGTTYTLALADNRTYILFTNAAGCAITVPPQSSVAWASNSTIALEQTGAGQITVAAGAGVTLNVITGFSAKSFAQHGVLQLIRTASDTWTLFGALST